MVVAAEPVGQRVEEASSLLVAPARAAAAAVMEAKAVAQAAEQAKEATAEEAVTAVSTEAGTMAASMVAVENIHQAEQVPAVAAKVPEGDMEAPVHVGAAVVAAWTRAGR